MRISILTLLFSIFLAFPSLSAGVSDVNGTFDPSAPAEWMKVQDGEVQQWTHHFKDGATLIRIDAVWSDESPVTLLIRTTCMDTTTQPFSYVFYKPGNLLGVGLGCTGEMIFNGNIYHWLEEAGGLPREVIAAINE